VLATGQSVVAILACEITATTEFNRLRDSSTDRLLLVGLPHKGALSDADCLLGVTISAAGAGPPYSPSKGHRAT